MLETHVRRRTPGACSAVSNTGGTCVGSADDAQQYQPGVFDALYTTFGGWLIEAWQVTSAASGGGQAVSNSNGAAAAAAAELPRPRQSLGQVLEHYMSSWAMRAAMLNMCLPASMWNSPQGSRATTPTGSGGSSRSSSEYHPLHAPADSPLDSPRNASAGGAAAAGTSSSDNSSSISSRADGGLDVLRGCGCDCTANLAPCSSNSSSIIDGRCKCSKAATGCLPKSASCSNIDVCDQQLAEDSWLAGQQMHPEFVDQGSSSSSGAAAAARDAADGMVVVAAAAAAGAAGSGHKSMRCSLTSLPSSSHLEVHSELLRLKREVSSLRSCLGNMTLTCAALKEENQRLHSSDCSGEELLSGALQQLLGEKSVLLQEVSRLSRQNQALQELLDFTAPVTSGAVEFTPASPEAELAGAEPA